MKTLKLNEIEAVSSEISKIRTSKDNQTILFFPIDLVNEITELDCGLSMFTTASDVRKGTNGSIEYGLVPTENGVEIHTALYAKDSAVLLNLKDFIHVHNSLNEQKLDKDVMGDLECRVLRPQALLFKVK